ncbi:20460_t:CDS:1, partial [Gigaspora rosea]
VEEFKNLFAQGNQEVAIQKFIEIQNHCSEYRKLGVQGGFLSTRQDYPYQIGDIKEKQTYAIICRAFINIVKDLTYQEKVKAHLQPEAKSVQARIKHLELEHLKMQYKHKTLIRDFSQLKMA